MSTTSVSAKRIFNSKLISIAALDSALLGAISFIGPLNTVVVLAGTTLLALISVLPTCFVLATALTSHISLLPGVSYETIRAVKWAIFIAFLWMNTVQRFYKKESLRIEWGAFEKAFLLFILWGFVSSFAAVRPGGSLWYIVRMGTFLLIYFAARETITTPKLARGLCYAVILAVLTASLYSLYELSGGTLRRISGFSMNPNSFGLFLFSSLPFLAIGFLTGRSRIEKAWFAIGLAALSVSLLLAFTRASILGCFGLVFVYLAYERKRLLRYSVAAAVVVIPVILLIPSVFDAFYDISRLGFGVTRRDVYWRHGLQAFVERPIMGYGLDMRKEDVRGQEALTNIQEIIGFHNTEGWYDPHNSYIRMLVSLGLPGFILSIVIYFALFKERISWRRASAGRSQRIVQTLTIAMIVGGALNSMFETGPLFGASSYKSYYWLMLGLSAAVHKHKIDLDRTD